jgi:hypothetical protein
MTKIRASAQKAMQELRATAVETLANAAIDRVTLDITSNEQREVVTLHLRDSKLIWSCTCGRRTCAHVAAALSWISGELDTPARNEVEPKHTIKATTSAWSHLSWPPDLRTLEDFDQAARADIAALAASLEELAAIIVNCGTDAGLTASVETAIGRLIEIAPKPLPLGISRWIGRLKVALIDRSVEGVARLLDGASKLVTDLCSETRDMTAVERVVSWLGAYSADKRTIERISDRSLLEIAREWMDGTERYAIEKRYLVDLHNGEVFREERARDFSSASLGPCPRLVSVSLAAVEQGAQPRRVRLLQYSTAVTIPDEAWKQLASWANRTFAPLQEIYHRAVTNFPGLTEPFVVVAPAQVARDPHPVPVDESGHPLPLAAARDPYALKVLDALTANQRPEWIAGRLVDAQGTLMMRPLSFGVTHTGQFLHVRL